MVRQRAGTALQHALLQLSAQDASASTIILARLCASTFATAHAGASRSFSSAAGRLLPELQWQQRQQQQQQQDKSYRATAPAPCQQLITLRSFHSATVVSHNHSSPAVQHSFSGAVPQPPQLLQRQPVAAQQPYSVSSLRTGSREALQHEPTAAGSHGFRVAQASHRRQTLCSDAAWQQSWAQQPAPPQMLALGAWQPSGTRQMHGVAAAWQRAQLQQPAAPPPAATGQQGRGFATAWQRGRAQQAANRRGGRDAAPEPPKKPRTNGEINGPHVRLVFPDGTHKVPPLPPPGASQTRTAA